jgi:hypothetical protein
MKELRITKSDYNEEIVKNIVAGLHLTVSIFLNIN